MCVSQFLLEDNEYTFGLFDSWALFAMADELLEGADIVRLTPSVEAPSRNTEIEVLWAA